MNEQEPKQLTDKEFKERKGLIESVVGDKIDRLARQFLLAEKLGLKEEALKHADEIKKLYEEAEKETEFQTKWSALLTKLYENAEEHYQNATLFNYEAGFKKFVEAKFGPAVRTQRAADALENGEFVVIPGTNYVFRFYGNGVALSNWPYLASVLKGQVL